MVATFDVSGKAQMGQGSASRFLFFFGTTVAGCVLRRLVGILSAAVLLNEQSCRRVRFGLPRAFTFLLKCKLNLEGDGGGGVGGGKVE